MGNQSTNGKAQTLAGNLFKTAENTQAYLKLGVMGFPGAGKTYTMWLIALGLAQKLSGKGKKVPIAFIDSETGSDFLVKLAKEAGIPFYVVKTRSFADLNQGIIDAETSGAILIIDSITHFWQELLRSYLKSKGRNKMYFHDWGPVKETWRAFTDLYVNSKVHILMAGRAGYEYEYTTDSDGDKQLEKTGTKMKVESDMGYEPSLLVEMERAKHIDPDEGMAGGSKKKKIHGILWDHVAHVLKDRTRTIEGKTFVNPTFTEFSPAIEYLNLGGTHVGVETNRRTSAETFEKDVEKEAAIKKRNREIILEEIAEGLSSKYPGRTDVVRKQKADVINEVFGTRSWKRIEVTATKDLEAGLVKLKELLAKPEPEVTAG